jgi:hypothetical protein
MKNTRSKERDVPLRIQVEKGQRAFHRGKLVNPYKPNTSFYKEWERGFNKAYFENLKKIKDRLGSMTSQTATTARNNAS